MKILFQNSIHKKGDYMDIVVVLLVNSFVLLGLSSLNLAWHIKTDTKNKKIQFIYGIVFSGILILLMNLSWGESTGIFYDSRTILIAVISSFYGLFTTIILLIIGSLYRIFLGGDGMIAGIVTIICTGILGIIFKHYIKPIIKGPSFLYYYLFALVVHVFMLIYHFALPMQIDFILNRIKLISPTVLIAFPIITVFLAEIIKVGDDRINQKSKLVESEEQYRLLTSEMGHGLALHEVILDESGCSIDYKFISVNDAYEQLTGLKREDIIGKTILEILPNTENHWIETFGAVALNRESIIFENFSPELNKYFSTSVYSPKKGQFAVIIEEITDRILAENHAKKEKQDLITSQKIAKLGTWKLDINTNQVTWSEELYKMYGFDSTKPVPPYTEHKKLFTKQSWDILSKALALTSTKGVPYELELEMALEGNKKGWIWVKGEAEYNDQGEIVSLTGAAQDITEKKIIANDMEKNHQIIAAVLHQSPISIEFYNANGSLVISNEVSHQMYGVKDLNSIKGINLFDNPNLSEEVIEKIKLGENIHIELEFDFGGVSSNHYYETSKNGKMLVEISITPLKINNIIDGYIIHSEDITEERRRQNEIEYVSNHDYLTDLFNRRYIVNAFDAYVKIGLSSIGLMMIDINGLKLINDAYGHVIGDETIKAVSNILMQVFDKEEIVARIGGDEFAVLLTNKTFEEIQVYKEKLVELAEDVKINAIQVSLAIGYEIFNEDEKDINELLSRAEKHLYRHKVTVGESVRNHAIAAILNTLTDKYKEEKIHSENVSHYCKQMGTALGLNKEEIDLLGLAGMYHDIGKISIPDAILNKPGKLTIEEYDIIKTHTQIGYKILKAADEYSGLAEYALSHHERWDGKGYPKGLAGEDIPLYSRIICISDAFEAMTADRPYRKAIQFNDAVNELYRCSGTQFDSKLVEIFVKDVLSKEFPKHKLVIEN